jgi:hypothetical protein
LSVFRGSALRAKVERNDLDRMRKPTCDPNNRG